MLMAEALGRLLKALPLAMVRDRFPNLSSEGQLLHPLVSGANIIDLESTSGRSIGR